MERFFVFYASVWESSVWNNNEVGSLLWADCVWRLVSKTQKTKSWTTFTVSRKLKGSRNVREGELALMNWENCTALLERDAFEQLI